MVRGNNVDLPAPGGAVTTAPPRSDKARFTSPATSATGRAMLLFRYVLQDLLEILPGTADGSDVHALVRGMRILDGGSDRDHLPVRVLGAEEGALEAAVGGHDLHRIAVHLLELLHHHLVHRGVQFRRPAAVTALELDLVGTGQLEDAADTLGQGGLRGVDGAAHQGMDRGAALLRADDGHVDGGLGEAFHRLAHADDAGRAGQEGLDEVQHHAALQILGSGGDILHEEDGARVAVDEFGLDLIEDVADELLHGLQVLGRDDHFRDALGDKKIHNFISILNLL